jgi:hypothetical protein
MLPYSNISKIKLTIAEVILTMRQIKNINTPKAKTRMQAFPNTTINTSMFQSIRALINLTPNHIKLNRPIKATTGEMLKSTTSNEKLIIQDSLC